VNPWRWVDPRVARVRVADIRAYFLGRGWKPGLSSNPNLLRFEEATSPGQTPLFQMVPASEQSPDYCQRVTELITTVSELEDRHPVAILEDMLAAAQTRGNGAADGSRTASPGKR
jgi:hypothetical protein